MSGARLEVEVHLVTGAVTSVQNVDPEREPRRPHGAGHRAGAAGLRGGGGLAGGEGAGHSPDRPGRRAPPTSALFRDGAVWYTGILPLGGDHISNDIAVGLRTPTSDAEELEEALWVCAHRAGRGGRDDRRAERGRAQAAPALTPDPVRDRPAAGGGDLHLGRPGPDAGRAAGCGGGGRGGDGRHVHHAAASPSSPSRSSTCPCAAACPRRRPEDWPTWCTALYIATAGGPGAVRRAAGSGRGAPIDGAADGSARGIACRDWLAKLF